MLTYLQDSEDLQVDRSELKEQPETPEEAGFSIRQGMREAKSSSRCSDKKRKRCTARWDTQLKRLVELERRCQDLMQEVQLQSERQELLDENANFY